jgi:two-component system, OmpR family, copper resistance phosphate regulon response regulator CusR
LNILIVEDEIKLVAFLKQGLEENGYRVDVAYDGQMGETLAFKNIHDLIILDLIIPQINGIDLCKKIREKNDKVLILMLTALGSMNDKMEGFDAGADDYLTKPFEFQELLARVKALAKRGTGLKQNAEILEVYGVELNTLKKTVKRENKIIPLTGKEFSLLEYMMRNKERVLSRSELARHVWDINFDTGTNVVDVYINILRKKIDNDFEKKLIHTRIGLGYFFDLYGNS